MRRIVIEIVPNEMVHKMLEPLMTKVEEMEMVDLLRLDVRNGIKIGVVRFKLRPGVTLHDAEATGLFQILEIIEEREGEALCLVKGIDTGGFDDLKEKADLDLKMVPPMLVKGDRIVFSFIGEDDQIAKMIDVLKSIGLTYNLSIHQAAVGNGDLLSALTNRQRGLLLTAKRMGYYEYPRRAGAEEVAKEVGLSPSTVIEHLRKSEVRLMDEILAGYH